MTPARRFAAPLFVALVAASATGCFALFSLDEYGPLGGDAGAVDAFSPVDTGPADVKVDAAPVDTRPTKRVFITSTTSNGNLNGVGGADNTCQLLATGAGLGGTFKAWISHEDQTPRARFFPADPANKDGGLPDVRIIDTSGRTVAQSWASYFAAKNLLVPIEHTERGAKVAAPDAGPDVAQACGGRSVIPVWTNTNVDGTAVNADGDCGNFLTSEGSTRAGYVSSDATWTNGCPLPCTVKAHLYCFEQ